MDGDGAASLFSYGLERLILGCTTLVIFNSVYCFWGGRLTLERLVPEFVFIVFFTSFGPPASSSPPCQIHKRFSNCTATLESLHSRQTTADLWVLCVKVSPRRLDDQTLAGVGRTSRTTRSSTQTVTAASSEERPRAPHQGTRPPLILPWSRG